MKKQTFEEYLQTRFFSDCPELSTNKDDFISNYEKWIIDIEVDDWIKYATQWEAVINF